MEDRNIRNKRVNDKAPNVNTRKRYNNNVLEATKAGPNKQMRPTEGRYTKTGRKDHRSKWSNGKRSRHTTKQKNARKGYNKNTT